MAKELFRKGGSSSSERTPDTLFSEDTVEAILAVSEGPIYGLEKGAASFFLDDTPLVDASGNSNFREFELTVYPGSPTGEDIASKLGGFASSTTINTDLAYNVPVVRSAVHTSIGAIDIRFRINSLVKSSDRGSYANRLIIKIEYKKSGSPTWTAAWLNNPSSPDPVIDLAPNLLLFRQYNANVKKSNEAARAFSFELDGIVLVDDTPPGTDGYPADKTFWLDSDNDFRPQVNTAGVWAGSPTLVGSVWTLGTRKFIKSATMPTTGYVLGDVWVDTVNIRALIWNGVVWTRPGLMGTTFDATGNAAQSDGTLDIEEKISSQTVKEIRFFVDEDDSDTYDIRIMKLSPDTHTDGDTEYTSEVQWESYEEITRKKFSWKNLAVIQAVGRATDQFNSMPTWNGVYLGRMIKVPSNYDPATRVYTGIWDGTWKIAYSNNTAYIFKDFVENTDYGLSSLYPHYCNNSDIYEWGMWNDTPVSNGAGGTRPRWTFNDYIQKAQPARELAQYIAGAASARYYDDGNGNVTVKLDKDDDAVTVFTQENVTVEGFNYSHTDRQTRANDLQVSFVNPDLNWQEDKRRVFDQTDIDDFGRIPDEFIAVGCIDLSEALARARYRLATNLTEKRVITFTTTRKGRYLKFWDIILIADEDMGFGISRRIKSLEGPREIALRDPVSLEPGFTYVAKFECVVDGVLGVVTRTITDDPGVTHALNFDEDLPDNIPLEAAFSIEASNSVGYPKPFRVTRISPVQDNANLVAVEAIEHNRLKYDYVDGGTDTLEDVDYSNLAALASQPVDNLTIEPFIRQIAGRKIRSLRVTWTQESSRLTREYLVKHIIDGITVNSFTTKEPLVEIADANQGMHRFVVQAVSFLTANPGQETSVAIDLTGEVSVVLAPTGLALKDEASSSVFARKSPAFQWDAYTSDPNFSHFLFRTNRSGGYEINVGAATEYVYPFEAHDGTRSFTASVVAVNQFGDESPAATVAVSNTQAAAPTSVAIGQAGDQLLVSWALPSEPDYAGTRVYASQTTGFTPGPGNLVWEGYSDRTQFTIAAAGDWYIRVGHYDEFKSTDIALATQASINVTSLISAPVEDLFGSTEDAAASAAAAALAQTNAELAEANAAAAQAASEAAQADAETALAGSVSSQAAAAASQAAAAASQSAASGSATTASTAATNASTANTNAQAAKTAAQTAETNATTQATNSANSATAASGSATSASGFATNASNSATTSAGSATASAASATAAAASATGAAGSATAAASSATAAATSATDAGTFSSAASTSSVSAQSVANRLLPDRPEIAADFSNSGTGNGTPTSLAAASSGSIVSVTNEGNVRQYTGANNVVTRGWLSVGNGRTFSVTLRAAVTVDGTANMLYAGFTAYAADGTYLGNVNFAAVDSSHVVADGWQEFTVTTTSTAILAAFGTAAFIRGRVNGGRNSGGTTSGTTWQLSIIRLKDITSETSAAGSATAAATQASNAATSASGASTSASAANTSALNAATQASNAATSATNAATSETNAAGSASTASTQAGLAAGSAGSAGTSATAAAGSATTAATHATNAGTSASTATTQAGLAAGSATAAGGSATAAAGSASTASTQATNAGNSATSAAASSVSAQSVATRLLPDRPATAADFVASTGAGAPDTATVLSAGTIVAVTGEGDVRQFTTIQPVYTRGGQSVVSGHVYRYTTRTRVTVDGTSNVLVGGFAAFASDWSYLGTVAYGTLDASHVAADGWQTHSTDVTYATIVAAWPTAAYVRAVTNGGRNVGNTASGATWQLAILSLRDVTSEVNAAGSATAAATSASAASTSASGASTSATAANTSALNAATQASNASTSATNAATSETNAAGSASTATTQAGLAAGSATTAGGHASAASGSASTATTQATNAGNSATSANTSAISAQSVANRLLPDRPSVATDFVDNQSAGAPDTATSMTSGTTTTVAVEGAVRQFTARAFFYTRGVLPVGTGRTFRVETRSGVTVDGTGNRVRSGWQLLDSTYTQVGTITGVDDASAVVADGFQSFTRDTTSAAILAVAATAVYVRAMIIGGENSGSTSSGATWQVSVLRLRDVTDVAAAAASASAANTSASTATTQATNAGNSATAANTSALSAASSFSGANLAAAQVGPRNFAITGQWSLDYNTVATTMTNVDANASYAVMGTYSGAATVQLKDPGFALALKPKTWYPVVASDKIRIQGSVRALTDAAGTCAVTILLQGCDAPGGGTFKANVSYTVDSNLTTADGIVAFDQILTVPASGSTWFQPQIARTTTGAPTIEVISFLYENVTAKEAAATSAGAASVSASAAAGSSSTASGHASTASTQAGLAAGSATAASGSASAANTSASTASTQATNASNSATAANTSALSARSITNRALPDRPGDDSAAFTAAYTTYSGAAVLSAGTVVAVTGEGNVWQTTATGSNDIATQGYLPVVSGRTYKLTYRIRKTADGSGSDTFTAWLRSFDATGTYLAAHSIITGGALLAAAGWQTFTGTFTGAAIIAAQATAAYIRADMRGTTTTGAVWQCSIMKFEDATAVTAADASATAAAASSVSASGFATAASTSATTSANFATAAGAGSRSFDFQLSGLLWTNSVTGTSTAAADPTSATYTDVSAVGKVHSRGGAYNLCSKYVFIPVTGRTYKISARVRRTVDIASGSASISFDLYRLDSAYGAIGNAAGGAAQTVTVASGWVTLTATYTAATLQTGSAAYCRPRLETNGDSLSIVQVQSILIEDVSDITATNATVAANTSAIATETSARTTADTTLRATIQNGFVALGPSNFSADGLYWTTTFGGTPGAAADPTGVTYADVTNLGRVLQTASFPVYLTPKAVMLPTVGKRYRVTAEVRAQADATGGTLNASLLNVNGLNTSWAHGVSGVTQSAVSGLNSNENLTVAGGWKTIGVYLTLATATTYDAAWRPRLDMTRSAGSGGTIEVRKFLIEDVTDSYATNATVAEVKTAVTDSGGAYAYYGLKVDGSGRFASIEAMASTKTNVSQIKMTADKFTVQTATLDKQVFTVTGDEVTIDANLLVGGSIAVGAAKLKVALESIKKTGADGDAITWASGVSIGSAPEVVLDLSTLSPLTTGEAYSVSLTGLTGTGATVYAKILTPGTTSTVSQTTDASGGGGNPDRVMAKTDSADAYDNTYYFRIVGTIRVQSTNEGAGLYSHEAYQEVSTWFNDGGGWDQGPTIALTTASVGIAYTSGGSLTGNYSYDVIVPVSWTNPIGAGSTYDFGVTLVTTGLGQALNDLYSVTYNKQTSSGTRTASPAGQTVKITAFPRNA